MASNDDLMLVMKTLFESVDKIKDSHKEIKCLIDDFKAMAEDVGSIAENVVSIAEDVEHLNRRLDVIEYKVSSNDQLNVKSEVLSLKETLDTKLRPLGQVQIIAKRLSNMEKLVSNLRSIDDTPSKSDLLSIKEFLDRKLKPLDQIGVINEKVTPLEKSMATVSKETACPPIQFDSTIKGRMVHLTNNGMCAERQNAYREYGFAGVVSNIPLKVEQLFKIKIENKINEWENSGIAIGVICGKAERVKTARMMYYTVKETLGINSSVDTISGKSDIWTKASEVVDDIYPLDTRLLKVGTVLGIKLCSNGDLRFYLNGGDRGIAFTNVPRNVFAFVDILYNVTKISIVQ